MTDNGLGREVEEHASLDGRKLQNKGNIEITIKSMLVLFFFHLSLVPYTYSPTPIFLPPSAPIPSLQESFVEGVHLEQLCHTCFHVLLDYRAAGPGFEAALPPPLPSSSLPSPPFVSVQFTLVINFVLLLFVPVTRSPLF